MDRRAPRHLELRLLAAVQNIREENPDLCDVVFEVGPEKVRFDANSTILALRSEYFKAMCYGPLRNPDKVKEIPDVSANIFAKVLDFIHGKEESLRLDSLDMVWQVRYAAQQFLITDLVDHCNHLLEEMLNFKNGLIILRQASEFKADEIKRKVYKVIRNRHSHVLNSQDVKHLDLDDFIDLIKLYRNVKADYIIKAISIWCESLESTNHDFKDIFREKFFKHIKWDNLSNENMIELHELKVLPLELENEAMVKILARSRPPPEEEVRTVCNLEIQARRNKSQQSSGTDLPVVKRLFLRTVKNFTGSLSSAVKDGSMIFDGMEMLRDVLSNKSLQGTVVDASDLSLEYSINQQPIRLVQDLKVVVYPIRYDNRDIFFFELTFPAVTIESDKARDVDIVFFEVSFDPALLKDLIERNISTNREDALLRKISKVDSSGLQLINKKTWRVFVNGQMTLSSDDNTPKHFFEGCGVPVFCRVN